MRRLAHGRVVHVEVAANGADDDLARIEPDPDLHVYAMGAARLFGISLDRFLHPQSRIARAHRVVFVRHGSAEERHDAVTHDLVHQAFVAVDGLHHVLEHRVKNLASLLGISIGEQFH